MAEHQEHGADETAFTALGCLCRLSQHQWGSGDSLQVLMGLEGKGRDAGESVSLSADV